jgi:pantothenate kinase
LERVRARRADVLVPRFDRSIEAAIAGSLRISPAAELVVTEGNYLLLDEPGWREVHPLLDESWLLAAPHHDRIAQLTSRHIAHGRSPDEAAAWVRDVDEPNARKIAASTIVADLVIDRHVSSGEGG